MKKVLFTATVDSHILQFHLPYLKLFKEKGYEVHVATNGDAEIPYCDVKHKVCFEKSPLKINNLRAIKQLKKIINEEKFDIIHCHTPMGSVVTRLAARSARKNGTRVIYTAHGFHFFKGAPAHYWMMFYPIEKYLSKFTDTLILINKEDYELAKRKFKKCKDIQYVPGVGIDEKKFDFAMSEDERTELRASLGLKKDDFVMIFPAELSKRKRQEWLIEALKETMYKNKDIHLLLPGEDSLNGICDSLVKKLKLEKQVHLLGYRKDIPKLLKISDLAISSARQEGLPVNLMEAMFVGVPTVATNCRGNRDLVKDGTNGYIVEIEDVESFSKKVESIYRDKNRLVEFSKNGQQIIRDYLLEKIIIDMENIYFRKKKVLHVLASNIFSGAENVACTIINSMSDRYDMAYCSPKGKIESVLIQKNIKYYGIDKLSVKELKNVIKLYEPDYIHAHDFKAAATVVLTGFKGKIISHLHKNDPAMKKISIKSILFLILSKRIYKIIGVSDGVIDEYVFGDKIKNKYSTIFNWVDSEKIISLANQFRVDKDYDVFFFGRLSDEKNPLEFIEIIKELDDKEVKCVMIGDGELYEECKNKIREYNLEYNIDMIGFQENPFPYIKAAKVGIMPSKFEGFGLTAVEAAILGKFVLNSGAGGLKQIFENEDISICNTRGEYVEKIKQIKKDDIAIDSRININNYCSYDSWMSKLLKIYE